MSEPTAPVGAAPAYVLYCIRCAGSRPITAAEHRGYTDRTPARPTANALPRCCGRKMACLPLDQWDPELKRPRRRP